MVNGAVVLHQHRRRAMTAQRLDDPPADRVVADQRERADRDLAAELVGHHRQHARDRPRRARPRRWRTSSGCAPPRRPPACACRRRHARRCPRTANGRRRPGSPSRSVTTIASGRQLVVAHPGRLDHQQVVTRHPGRHVAGRPHHQPPARQLRVQRRDLGPQPGHDLGDGRSDRHRCVSFQHPRRRSTRQHADVPGSELDLVKFARIGQQIGHRPRQAEADGVPAQLCTTWIRSSCALVAEFTVTDSGSSPHPSLWGASHRARSAARAGFGRVPTVVIRPRP